MSVFITPKFIAHRGANHFAPENTLPAFQFAHRQKAAWVEFDVQLSKDNIPVIIHDETVDRTTDGKGLVKELTFAQLRQLALIEHGYRTHIPSLSQTLDYLTSVDMSANIEIKSVSDPHCPLELLTAERLDTPRDRKNTEITCNLLKSYLGGKSQFLISSFCMEALIRAKQVLPEVPRGLLLYIKNWEKEWPLKERAIRAYAKKIEPTTLNINHATLTQERIKVLKSICPNILVYTVNSRKRAETLFSFDIQGIFSDNLLIF